MLWSNDDYDFIFVLLLLFKLKHPMYFYYIDHFMQYFRINNLDKVTLLISIEPSSACDIQNGMQYVDVAISLNLLFCLRTLVELE